MSSAACKQHIPLQYQNINLSALKNQQAGVYICSAVLEAGARQADPQCARQYTSLKNESAEWLHSAQHNLLRLSAFAMHMQRHHNHSVSI